MKSFIIYSCIFLLLFGCEPRVFSSLRELDDFYCAKIRINDDIIVQIDAPLKLQKNESLNNLAAQCKLIIGSPGIQPSQELLKAYIITGKYYILKNKYDDALRCFKTAEQILDSVYNKHSYLYGIVYQYTGNVYYLKLQYLRAVKYYEKTMKLANEYDIISDYLWINYANLSLIYEELKEYDKAIYYNIEYLKLPETGIRNKIKCYTRLSSCYCATREFDKAEYYNQLAEHYAIPNLGPGCPELIYIYNIRDDIYKLSGDNDKRYNCLNKTYKIIRRNYPDKNILTATALANLAAYYYETEDYPKALDTWHKTIIASSLEFNDTSIYSNPDIDDTNFKEFLALCFNKKAITFFGYYKYITGDIRDLLASLECFENATKGIEKIYTSFIDEDAKLGYIARQRRFLNRTIKTAILAYEETQNISYLEKALSYSEKSKSAILLSYLNEQKDKRFAGIPDSLINTEKEIRNELASLDYIITSGTKSETMPDNEYNKIKTRYFNLLLEEEKLIDYYESNYPEYYNLKYNITAISLKQIQNLLDKDQVLVEYTNTGKELYTFVITDDSVYLQVQNTDSSFTSNIITLREYLSENKFGNYDIDDLLSFVITSYNLYVILIDPIRAYIKDKELIIVPDESLNLIPFEVLLTNDSVKGRYADFGALPYLFMEYPISYSYSAGLLINQKQKRYKGKKSAAFVPKYPEQTLYKNLLHGSINGDIDRLIPLYGAEKEAEYLSGLYNFKIFNDNQATEDNFKRSAVRYNIVHLAMHTIVDDKNPMHSKMVFTPGADSIEDGLLHTFELYGIKLKANLISLSSCNTGYGKMQQGEGLLSLARGFLYAGCPGLLLTQWAVADKASAELIKSFYYYLSKGFSKDKALQLSRIDYLKNADPVKNHPYFWAGYIIVGDTSPLPVNKRYNYLVILIAIPVLASFYILRQKKKRGIQGAENNN